MEPVEQYRELKNFARAIGLSDQDFFAHWGGLQEVGKRPDEITQTRLDKMRQKLMEIEEDRSESNANNTVDNLSNAECFEPGAERDELPQAEGEAEAGRSAGVYAGEDGKDLPGGEPPGAGASQSEMERRSLEATISTLSETVSALTEENAELERRLAQALRTIDTWEAALRKAESELWLKLRDKYICAVAQMFVGHGAAEKAVEYADQLLAVARPEQNKLKKSKEKESEPK